MTVELRAEFLERESRRLADTTLRSRRTGLNRYEDFLEERGLSAADMGRLDFEDLVGWLTVAEGVSDRTAFEYLVSVSKYHEWRSERGDDVHVPDLNAIAKAEGLELRESESDKHVDKSQRALTAEKMELLIEHAPAPKFRNQLIMKMMGSTGIRPRDLRDLRLRDLSDDYQWLHVRSSKTASRRRLPVPEGLRRYLRLWLESGYRDACLTAESSDHLIPGEWAEKLGHAVIGKVVDRAATEAGVQEVLYIDAAGSERKRITPYSFRYGYANHMKNKVDPERLQQLMGHRDVSTTLQFYNSASEEELRQAAELAPDP